MPEDSDKEMGGIKDVCGILMRILLVVAVAIAIALSSTTAFSCEFVDWELGTIPEGKTSLVTNIGNVTTARVGLFRWDPDGEGCRDISDDFDDALIGGWFTAARVGSSLALVLGIIGICLLGVDLLCCRFPCSRLFISTLFVAAAVSQALTFLVYAGEVCEPTYKGGPIPCNANYATWMSVASLCIFLLGSVLSCLVPKPVPAFHRLKNYIANDQHDPCCYLCTKTHPRGEAAAVDEEVTDEEADATDTGKVAEMDEVELNQAKTAQAKSVVPSNAEETAAGWAKTEKKAPLSSMEGEDLAAVTGVVTALAAIREAKQKEVILQLDTLDKYKEYIPQEEFEQKVRVLLDKMPDPESYDKFTKTATLLDLESGEADERMSARSVDAVDLEEGSAPDDTPGDIAGNTTADTTDVSAPAFKDGDEAHATETTEGAETGDSLQPSGSMNDETKEGTTEGTTESETKGAGKKIKDSIGSTGKAIGSSISSGAGAIKNVMKKKPALDV